jgi:flagellar biosynthesis protein FlhB
MSPETVKAVQEALAPMAQKLGEGAAHLYEIYVRQMFAEAVASGVVLLVLSIGLFAFWILWYKSRKAYEKKHHYASDLSDGLGIAGSFATVVMTVLIPFLLFDTITKLINPEYYAIERIITQVRGDSK